MPKLLVNHSGTLVNGRALLVVRDKLKRDGVSSEEAGNAVLVREHDLFTVLGIAQSCCYSFSIGSLWH